MFKLVTLQLVITMHHWIVYCPLMVHLRSFVEARRGRAIDGRLGGRAGAPERCGRAANTLVQCTLLFPPSPSSSFQPHETCFYANCELTLPSATRH